jgi:hypothetical protein
VCNTGAEESATLEADGAFLAGSGMPDHVVVCFGGRGDLQILKLQKTGGSPQ